MRIEKLAAVTALLFVTLAADAPPTSVTNLLDKGHFKLAQAILTPQLKQNPNDGATNCAMSKVSGAYSHWDDAVQQAEKAVSSDDKRADYHAQLADALVSKLSKSDSGFFAKMSLANRFKKEALQALQLDPKNVDANTDLMEFYLEAPGIVGGGTDKARDLAENVVRIDPPHGYFMKAQIANHEKRAADAEQFFNRAVEAAPAEYEFRVALANFYVESGPTNFAVAEEQARQAIKTDAERVTAYTTLASLYTKQARWRDLEAILAESERRVPDDFGPFYQSAKAILVGGDGTELARAEGYLRKYLSQPCEGGEPPLAAGHWRLGLVLEKEGRKDEAKNEVQAAVNLDPTFKPAQQDLKRLK